MTGSPRAIDLFTMTPPSYLHEVVNDILLCYLEGLTLKYCQARNHLDNAIISQRRTNSACVANLRKSTKKVFISELRIRNENRTRTATTGNFLPAGILAGAHTLTVKPEQCKLT